MKEAMENYQLLPETMTASLYRILDYLWDDEKRFYDEQPEYAGACVFPSLKSVADWLEAEADFTSQTNREEE
jgi:hypothetical protein